MDNKTPDALRQPQQAGTGTTSRPVLYQIRGWDHIYENSRSRTIEACNWVPLPNKQDGLGYCQLVASHGNGMAHYGIWVALVCLCSKQPPSRQGFLTDDGTSKGRPLTSENLALITRSPTEMIIEAFPRFVEIGWMDEIPVEKDTALPSVATALPSVATALPLSRKEGRNRKKSKAPTPSVATTGVGTFFMSLSRKFHEHQQVEFPNESCWKDFERTISDGAIELEKLARVDEWDCEDIERVLNGILKDDFWQKQVRSLRGIRKKSKSNGLMKIENARAGVNRKRLLTYDEMVNEISRNGGSTDDYEPIPVKGEAKPQWQMKS